MIQLLIVDTKPKEREFIEKCAHRQVLRLTDDRCVYNVFDSYEKAQQFIEECDILDIAIVDITLPQGTELIAKLRSKYRDLLVMIVAGSEMDPQGYVVPELSANSLIVRPSSPEPAEKAVRQLFDWFHKNIYSESGTSSYSFKGKDGRMMIDYSNIVYFESREKRIVLSTDNDEYYFYDTIDNLAQTLPASFVRCHRSFIVNIERIKNIRFSDNCIFLDNGFIVPLSRSYKTELKGRVI